MQVPDPTASCAASAGSAGFEQRKARLPALVNFRIGVEYAHTRVPKVGGDIVASHWLTPVGVGCIGQFDMDRARPWDVFVSLGRNAKDPDSLDVFFPRMKYDENADRKVIVFGVDRANEPKFIYPVQCRCGNYHGTDFVCVCGAEPQNEKAYAATFKEVQDMEYLVHTVPLCRSWMWLEAPADFGEAADLPLANHYPPGAHTSAHSRA